MSSLKTISVNTVSEYLSACDSIAAAGTMLFRGQTFDHPRILPTLFRISEEEAEKEVPPTAGDNTARLYMECYQIASWDLVETARRKRVEELFGDAPSYFSWLSPSADWQGIDPYSEDWPPVGGPGLNYTRDDFIAALTEDFLKDESRSLYQDGFLQHYGVRTRTLDVSYDPVIALWFATHELVTRADGSRDYETIRNGTPVVYVFPLAGAEVVDLRKIHSHPWDPTNECIPYFGLRGVQQKGGLYYGATRASPDLRPHLAYQFSFSQEIWNVEALGPRACNTTVLFPSSDEDFFFRELLLRVSNPKERYYPLKEFIIEGHKRGQP